MIIFLLYISGIGTLSIRSDPDQTKPTNFLTPRLKKIADLIASIPGEHIVTAQLLQLMDIPPTEEIQDNVLSNKFDNVFVMKFLEVLNNAMLNDFTNGCGKTFLLRIFQALDNHGNTLVLPNFFKSSEYKWRIFYNNTTIGQSSSSGNRQPDFACQVFHNDRLIE